VQPFASFRIMAKLAAFHEATCPETIMWTPADRTLVGDFGSGQALTDDQFWTTAVQYGHARPAGGLGNSGS
jgi:hypothetical protein